MYCRTVRPLQEDYQRTEIKKGPGMKLGRPKDRVATLTALFTRPKSSGQGHNLNGSNQERKRSVHIERRRLHHNQSIHGGKKRGWEHYVFTSNFWVVFHLLLNMFLSPQWK